MSQPILTSARLVLRPLAETDVAGLTVLRSNPEVNRYLDRSKDPGSDEAKNFLRKISECTARQECLYWALCPTGQQGLIGTICLWNFSEDRTRAEVGFELMPAWQGQGLMDEALKFVLNYAFTQTTIRIIVGLVHPQNLASARLLERNGFIPEARNDVAEGSNHRIYRLAKEAL